MGDAKANNTAHNPQQSKSKFSETVIEQQPHSKDLHQSHAEKRLYAAFWSSFNTLRVTTLLVRSIANLWRWELLMWSVGTASFLCTLALLYHFHNEEQSRWKSNVQITTLVAALAQVSQSALLVPIASSIGQLKWQWFETPQPAIDLDRFDTATRGPDGCLRLLYQLKRRPHLVCLGALSTLLLLVFPSFVQQSLAVMPRLVTHSEGHPVYLERSTYWKQLYVSADYTESLAVIRSMMNGYLYNANITGQCPTSDCTWEKYNTLAVCLATEEVSAAPRLSSQGRHGTLLGTGLNSTTFYTTVEYPQGPESLKKWEVQKNGSIIDLPTIANVYVDFYDPCLERDQNGTIFGNVENQDYWRSFKAELSTCIQTMESKYNSTWSSQIVDTIQSPLWYKAYRDSDTQNDTCTRQGAGDLCVAHDVPRGMGRRLQNTYKVNASIGIDGTEYIERNSSQWSRLILNDIRKYGEDECNRDPMAGFVERMQRIATSVSLEMRTDASRLNGTAWSPAQVIEVTFSWLAGPIILHFLITVFFLTTVLSTRKMPPWKSSALALLQSCGLENNGPETKDFKEYARTTHLRLQETGSSWRLIESYDSGDCPQCVQRRGDPCHSCCEKRLAKPITSN